MVQQMRFVDKAAVVTGAASGIGRATAIQLAAEGAAVTAVDVAEEGLAETAGLGEGLAGTITPLTADLRQRSECHRAVEQAISSAGRLDALCNVAGVNRPGRATDVTQDDWDFQMAVNVEGTFWTCQAAIPALIESDGAIVNTASNTSVQGLAYFAAYCASKGAVVALTRALAMEYARTGLRVNAVAPGGTSTPLNDGVARDLPRDIDFDLVMRGMGLRGDATPEQVAKVIVWAASSEALVVHGAIIHADQGLTTG